MYVPTLFAIEDHDNIRAFVAAHPSAEFISVDDSGQPHSTLMPCYWDHTPSTDAPYGRLVMHMSKANKQWGFTANGARVLAVVAGPQAYVSPTNYATKAETHKVVPTWNYTSVHLSGTAEISHDPELLLDIITKLTQQHEQSRNEPWAVSDAPADFIASQINGIVAVIVNIDRVEAKAKLSQNRSEADRAGVVADLAASPDAQDQMIGRLVALQDDHATMIED